jgi:hypothetical protein
MGRLDELRARLLRSVCEELLAMRGDPPAPSNADRDNVQSVAIAARIVERLGDSLAPVRFAAEAQNAQASGAVFARLVKDFLVDALPLLAHVRPGPFEVHDQKSATDIALFEPFGHLRDVRALLREQPKLRAILGEDYVVTPDVVVVRGRWTLEDLNARGPLLSDGGASSSPLLWRLGDDAPTLIASVSCKWTIRSDRAQNSRTEALNLLRNRRGPAPRIAAVTAEPLPSRLASVAYGLGDLDVVYHIALPELRAAVDAVGSPEARESLAAMVDGRRLRDVLDLPLDLVV